MSKINKIPSEIRNFFTEKRRDNAMEHKDKKIKIVHGHSLERNGAEGIEPFRMD